MEKERTRKRPRLAWDVPPLEPEVGSKPERIERKELGLIELDEKIQVSLGFGNLTWIGTLFNRRNDLWCPAMKGLRRRDTCRHRGGTMIVMVITCIISGRISHLDVSPYDNILTFRF